MKPEIKTRIAIIEIITEVLEQKRSLTYVLPKYLIPFKDPRDRALIQFCSYGILRDYLRLTFVIKKLVPRKIKEPKAYYLLLIGIYQLMFSRMPPFAIVHSTVDTTKELKLFSTTSLINAVLREFQRQQTTLMQALEQDPETKWSHPLWMLEHFQKTWPDQWENICIANNQQPPLWLRINTQRITPAAYIELLNANNIAIKSFHDEAVCLDSPLDVTELPGFENGLVSVQDAAGQLAAHLLDLQPQQYILDACAAPGGKTCHILEKEKTINIIAIDKDETRLTKVHENLNRLGLQATVMQGDALTPDTWWNGECFDRILIDAPCSALGVIRRHPDIKILRQPEDIPALASQQLDLLNTLWPLLKPHGKLLYATCSILPEENEEVVAKFCEARDDVKMCFTQKILPGEEDRDGFFYVLLEKSK